MDGKEMKKIAMIISVILTLCFICSCTGTPQATETEPETAETVTETEKITETETETEPVTAAETEEAKQMRTFKTRLIVNVRNLLMSSDE